MRTRFKIYGWTVLGILAFLATGSAQSLKKQTQAEEKSLPEARSLVNERLIRLAYRKVEVYAAVDKVREGKKLSEVMDPNERLRFRLSNFRTDTIEQLKDIVYNTAVSAPSEEIIQLTRSSESLNGRREQLAYRADWVAGKYGAMFDRNWTIGDVLKLESTRYFDVTRYTSYAVEVSFEGKRRSYETVVFHHGKTEDRKLEFLDPIVGMGGTLTSAWQDQLLPLGFDDPAQRDRSAESLVQSVNRVLTRTLKGSQIEEETMTCPNTAVSIGECGIANDLADFWAVDARKPWASHSVPVTQGSENLTSGETEVDPWITWYKTDTRGHISGTAGHYGWAQFLHRCVAMPENTQRCDVLLRGPEYGDNPDNHSDWWYHVGTGRPQTNARTGPRGQNVDCESAVGVAFDTCATSNCGVAMTIGITGQGANASVTISGGTLWNASHVEGRSCNLPATTSGSPGGCNQPAVFGCMSGFTNVGGTCVRSDAFVSRCFRFGDYDADTCACTGGCEGACSPIVVDVLGNGFNMTNASTGVFFDIEGKGTSAKFSWTAENSDDAWLALDRNNNGLIDTGKELFGNVTAQDIHPEGVERNGFLALALYDSPAYGGNGDGVITTQDTIFSRLKLWRDDNHNGISESCELFTLADLGLEKIDLDYKDSRRVDEHGNEFRYRSKVRDSRDSNIGRWAWDVFLVKQP